MKCITSCYDIIVILIGTRKEEIISIVHRNENDIFARVHLLNAQKMFNSKDIADESYTSFVALQRWENNVEKRAA